MSIPFLDEQTRILYSIAHLRNEWLDPIFLFLNYVDSEYFVMCLIPIVWIAISPKWGIRLSILLVINAALNHYLKYLFNFPRPMVYSPDLPMLSFTSPGLPSGGAQMSALLGGLLIYVSRKRWAWIVGSFFAALISFSRLYLGVHYPMDIIGGIIIGLALLGAFIYWGNPMENFCKKHKKILCGILIAIFCLLSLFFPPGDRGMLLAGSILGFILGTYLSFRFHLYPKNLGSIYTRIFNACITIIVVFALYYSTFHVIPRSIQAFIIASWISCGALPFCQAIKTSCKI